MYSRAFFISFPQDHNHAHEAYNVLFPVNGHHFLMLRDGVAD